MSGGEVNGLPPGWVATKLAAVGELVTGMTPSTKEAAFHGGRIPFVKPGDLDGEQPLMRTADTVTDEGAAEGRLLPEGTVLVSCIGNLGKTAILGRRAITNQQINAVVPGQGIESSYLLHWCRTLRPWMEANASATTVTILNKGRFATAPIRVAPLNEQKRIVAKIEALQARSDAAREALDAIPPLLEKFRQSVLAAAFRGDLSKAWREAHPDTEPATELLARIRAERRRRWQEANPGKKYVEPEPVDASGLPELPEGWCWVRLQDVARFLNGDRGKNYPNQSEYVETGLPFINTGHIRPNGTLSSEDMHYITREKFDELSGGKIQPGDLVYCLRGALGKTATVDPLTEGAIASSLVIIRPGEPYYARFLYYFLVSPLGRAEIKKYDNGSAQPNLSAASVAQYVVPMPPRREVCALSAALDETLAFAAESAAGIMGSFALLRSLNQSILAKAFRGELVPQDPNDEPASKLLDRIRRERERNGDKPSRRSRA
jgi:type I restriction enzyme S subunit